MNEPVGSTADGNTQAGPVAGPAMVRVWDPLVRIFHWTVVFGCVLDLFVLEEGRTAHNVVGYVVAGALAIRLLWGFVGPKRAVSLTSCPLWVISRGMFAPWWPAGRSAMSAIIQPARS